MTCLNSFVILDMISARNRRGTIRILYGGFELKKTLVPILIVLGLLAGSLSTIVLALRSGSVSPDPWEGVPLPKIKSQKWADWAGKDASAVDFSGLGALLATVTFDGATKWPGSDMMPKEVTPEEILGQGRYLGLGLRGLHEKGITGEGVSVAIIDKPLSPSHEAFRDNITYIDVNPEMSKEFPSDSHGAACAGILAGKDGVAPGARLYYFAVPDDGQPYLRCIEALEKLMELQEELPEENKIRVLSVSLGLDLQAVKDNTGGAADWLEAISRAKKAGIIVVYPGMSGLQYTGAGCLPGKDRDDPNQYDLWSWAAVKAEIVAQLDAAKANTWHKARQELIRLLTEDPLLDPLKADAIEAFIYLISLYRGSTVYKEWKEAMADTLPEALAVPADFLTVPSLTSDDAYAYLGAGGTNWSTPYLAGLMALGLQVRPDATAEDLYGALKETATTVRVTVGGPSGRQSTMKLVNPPAFIDRLAR